MVTGKWSPSKGREIDDIVDKLNELINAVNKRSKGTAEKHQNINVVKRDDGFALQFRTKEGIIESDPTYVTGFRKL